LTPEQACAVHVRLMGLTSHTLVQSGLGDVELWLDRVAPHPLVQDLQGAGVIGPRGQGEGGLGVRMRRALEDGLTRAGQVLLVGSDCPVLTPAYLREAGEILHRPDVDVVLGPAEDGGFVLVGCTRTHEAMFDSITWGSGRVLAQTLQQLDRTGLRAQCLSTLYDIDTPTDLARWQAEGGGEPVS
jgi:rSAM/selenodomain-associated transferase 1